MRIPIAALLLSAAAFGAANSFAADVSPGLWEITMETRMPSTPGFTPPPVRTTQCLSAEDARDPARLMGGIANPGASGCTYTRRSYSGNSLTFAMQCAGTFAIEASGEVEFTADTMHGSLTATADVGGSKVETRNTLSARRIGACPAAAQDKRNP